jgi:hypothetical protein
MKLDLGVSTSQNIVGAEKVFVHPFPVTIFGNTGMCMEQ